MKKLLKWALRAGFSILDQGLVSIGNFGLSVVLARILLPVAYGAFSIAFSTFLVGAAIHNAFLIEPMSVLGPARHHNELVPYLGRVFRLHILITVPLALMGVLGSVFFLRTPLGTSLLTMSLCLPFLLLFWTTRRAHYLESNAKLAATSSLLYCVALTTLMVLAKVAGILTVPTSFVAMAAASLIAAVFSLYSLKVGAGLGVATKLELAQAFREHWSFGKWILPSALLFPLISQIQVFATGVWLGLPAAGVLRALQNVMMPAIQVVTALALLAIPALARNFGEGKTEATYRRGTLYTIAMVLIAGVYEIMLVATGGRWDVLFYKGRYAGWDFLMPVLGLVPVASAVAGGCSVILRAVQRPGLITAANLAGGVFGIASIYPFIVRWHLAGAVYGLIGSQAVTAVASVALVIFSKLRPAPLERTARATESVPSIVFPSSEPDAAVANNLLG